MRIRTKEILLTVAALVFVALMADSKTSAQDGAKLAKSIFIQAQAMGQSTQLGRTFSVNIIINEFSTPDDQKALIEAFNQKGNEGLVNALSKMKSKGRLAITGTLGYEVTYIRQFPQPDGSIKIRLATNRPITFGEAWGDTRSMDYNLSGLEIVASADRKHNTGTLFPACRFKLDKENHLELELLQNEWKLVNIRRR
jgi:hypothetical protein